MNYTYHLLTLPHTKLFVDFDGPLGKFSSCAFTNKIRNMMKIFKQLDGKLITYGTEGSEVSYGDFVNVFSDQDFNRIYPLDIKTNTYDFSNQEGREIYCKNTIKEINKRRTGKDILLISYGHAHKPIKDGTKIPAIEMGIGYPTSMKDCYRVFESYSWMNNHYGKQGTQHPSQYDIVIPNYFDVNEYEFNPTPEDYYTFIGRPSMDKGWGIVLDVAKETGIKVKFMGQGGQFIEKAIKDKGLEGQCEHIGVVNPKERSDVIGKAIANFVPSQYIEPFGGVSFDSMILGTPVITSDNGVFSEYVFHGFNGYRCRLFNDYLEATEKVKLIDRGFVRKFGLTHSIENISKYYGSYFNRIENLLEGKGRYDKNVGDIEHAVRDVRKNLKIEFVD